MADTELSFQERQAASNALASQINEKAYIENDLLTKKLANLKELHSLTESSLEDRQAEIDLEIQIAQVQRDKETELRSIQDQQRRLQSDTASWLQSLESLADTDMMEQFEIDLQLNDQELLDEISALGPEIDAQIADLNARMQPVEIHADPLPMVKTMDFLPILEDGFRSAFANIGTYIGDALSGNEGAAGDFAAAMLSTLGDMAIKVGELAIATGMALSGIQAALNTMNPYAAIAAGAALVALGSAVKAGASNIARGGGYSSSALSTSYSSAASGDYNSRDISVNVTGTLVANGSQLVAVINNENKRKNLTT